MSSIDLVDIVNKKDQVIDQATREEAHANKLLHRSVAVFVFDEGGRLFVQPHVKSGRRYDHSVGGHVSAGETYHEAAVREMKEEIGHEAELTEVALSVLSDQSSKVHMFGIFTCLAPPVWKFEPNEEVHELVAMHLPEVISLMAAHPERFTGGFLRTMQVFQDNHL